MVIFAVCLPSGADSEKFSVQVIYAIKHPIINESEKNLKRMLTHIKTFFCRG